MLDDQMIQEARKRPVYLYHLQHRWEALKAARQPSASAVVQFSVDGFHSELDSEHKHNHVIATY